MPLAPVWLQRQGVCKVFAKIQGGVPGGFPTLRAGMGAWPPHTFPSQSARLGSWLHLPPRVGDISRMSGPNMTEGPKGAFSDRENNKRPFNQGLPEALSLLGHIHAFSPAPLSQPLFLRKKATLH